MTAADIRKMLAYLPPEDRAVGDAITSRVSVHQYARHYANLKFGHYFVRGLLREKKAFPLWLKSDDHKWLYRYYLFERGATDETVESAVMLALPEMTGTRQVIEALILSYDSSFAEIASKTGWSERVISAYEKLFFNIRDRLQDHLFLAQVAYPHTRIVETYPDYISNEDIGRLLRRIGHNNGIDHVLHFAGVKSELVSLLSSHDTPHKLEGTIMANGYLLARNGWLNDAKAEVIRSSRMFLAAAKQGGEKSEEQDPFLSASQSLMGELTRVKRTEALNAMTVRAGLYERQNATYVPEDVVDV